MRENGRKIIVALNDPAIKVPNQFRDSVFDFLANVYYDYFSDYSIYYEDYSKDEETTSVVLKGENDKCVIIKENDDYQAIFCMGDEEKDDEFTTITFKYNNKAKNTDVTLIIEKKPNTDSAKTINCSGIIISDDKLFFSVDSISYIDGNETEFEYTKNVDKHGNIINPLCATNYGELCKLISELDPQPKVFVKSNS